MNRKFFTAAALGFAVLFSLAFAVGCATPWQTAGKNIENSRGLRVGMSKSEVLTVMGEPIRDEKFGGPDLWFYYIEMVWGDGLITEDECMPLVFENGALVGWGNKFYVDYRLKKKDAMPTASPEK